MKPVGYLINRDIALEGERGLFYDYIFAGNGVYIQARNNHLEATISVAYGKIRGLAPLEEKMTLLHGKIPWRLYDLAYSTFLVDKTREKYIAVIWDNGYHLREPEQDRQPGSVRYYTESNVVLDMHSHGTGSGWFSGIDNQDEQGLRLSLVVGKIDMLIPEIELRIGVYGYYAPMETREVFGV